MERDIQGAVSIPRAEEGQGGVRVCKPVKGEAGQKATHRGAPVWRAQRGPRREQGTHTPSSLLSPSHLCLPLDETHWKLLRTHCPENPLDGAADWQAELSRERAWGQQVENNPNNVNVASFSKCLLSTAMSRLSSGPGGQSGDQDRPSPHSTEGSEAE